MPITSKFILKAEAVITHEIGSSAKRSTLASIARNIGLTTRSDYTSLRTCLIRHLGNDWARWIRLPASGRRGIIGKNRIALITFARTKLLQLQTGSVPKLPTLESMGQEHGISRERVRQILLDLTPGEQKLWKELRKKK